MWLFEKSREYSTIIDNFFKYLNNISQESAYLPKTSNEKKIWAILYYLIQNIRKNYLEKKYSILVENKRNVNN